MYNITQITVLAAPAIVVVSCLHTQMNYQNYSLALCVWCCALPMWLLASPSSVLLLVSLTTIPLITLHSSLSQLSSLTTLLPYHSSLSQLFSHHSSLSPLFSLTTLLLHHSSLSQLSSLITLLSHHPSHSSPSTSHNSSPLPLFTLTTLFSHHFFLCSLLFPFSKRTIGVGTIDVRPINTDRMRVICGRCHRSILVCSIFIRCQLHVKL